MGDTTSYLKLLAKVEVKYVTIIIPVDSNSQWLGQLMVTKLNVESGCKFAKMMWDSTQSSAQEAELQSYMFLCCLSI